jgi:hypothetical protein
LEKCNTQWNCSPCFIFQHHDKLYGCYLFCFILCTLLCCLKFPRSSCPDSISVWHQCVRNLFTSPNSKNRLRDTWSTVKVRL